MHSHEVKPGLAVFWRDHVSDPDGDCSGTGRVSAAWSETDAIIIVIMDDGVEVECTANDLTRLPTKAELLSTAEQAFWAALYSKCPHNEDGDVTPRTTTRLMSAMSDAIEEWLSAESS